MIWVSIYFIFEVIILVMAGVSVYCIFQLIYILYDSRILYVSYNLFCLWLANQFIVSFKLFMLSKYDDLGTDTIRATSSH